MEWALLAFLYDKSMHGELKSNKDFAANGRDECNAFLMMA
jgi:hypothetical protein